MGNIWHIVGISTNKHHWLAWVYHITYGLWKGYKQTKSINKHLGKSKYFTNLNLAAIHGDDFPRIHHDSPGSGEQWGRHSLPKTMDDGYVYIYILVCIYSVPLISLAENEVESTDGRHIPTALAVALLVQTLGWWDCHMSTSITYSVFLLWVKLMLESLLIY